MMPIYDYHCATCGSFEQRRPMAESAEPAACPVCHSTTARVLAAPRLNLMNGFTRTAEARNEKSAHAPEVVTRMPSHASKHGSAHHRHPDHAAHKPARPWMVGH